MKNSLETTYYSLLETPASVLLRLQCRRIQQDKRSYFSGHIWVQRAAQEEQIWSISPPPQLTCLTCLLGGERERGELQPLCSSLGPVCRNDEPALCCNLRAHRLPDWQGRRSNENKSTYWGCQIKAKGEAQSRPRLNYVMHKQLVVGKKKKKSEKM